MEVNRRKPSKEQIDFIYSRIAKHRELAESMYGVDKVVGVFVFGSWEWGSWCENSDVDTITLVLFGEYKETIVRLPDGSGEVSQHVDFEGYIAHFMNERLPMISFQALTILGAQYNYINPKYCDIWHRVQQRSKEIILLSGPKVAFFEKARLEDSINRISREIEQYGANIHAHPKVFYRVQQERRQLLAIANFQEWNDEFYNCLTELASERIHPTSKTLKEVYDKAIQELILMRKISIPEIANEQKIQIYKFLSSIIREIHSKT